MNDFKPPFFLHGGIITDDSEIKDIDSLFDNLTENFGNSYIIYSLLHELCGKMIKPNQNLLLYPDIEKDTKIINEESSCAILLLQDFIRPAEQQFKIDYEKWYELLSKINVPLFFPSLGINSCDGIKNLHKRLSPEVVKILKLVADKTELIGVRGYVTQEVLHNLGIDNVRVIGCPSFFKNGRNRFVDKKQKIDMNKVVYSAEYNFDLIKGHDVVIQGNNKELWNVLCFDKSVYDISDYNYKILKYAKPVVFSDCQSWEEYLSKFDFCLGVRLHGSIVALNSGVPAVCTNPDARAEELCSYLHIPYHPEFLNESNIQKIYDNCDWSDMNKNYNKLYDNFIDYLDKSGLMSAVRGGGNLAAVPEFRSPNIKCGLSLKNKILLNDFISIRKTSSHLILKLARLKFSKKL